MINNYLKLKVTTLGKTTKISLKNRYYDNRCFYGFDG